MKVTILGAGVGAANYSPDKRINKYPPAFVVEWGDDYKLLFDCSVGVYWRADAAGIDYASIHHVAISHSHVDHCAPIHFLQAVHLKGFWGGEKYKNHNLSFYGPDFLIDNFQTLFDIYTPNNEGKFYEWPSLQLQPMSKGDKLHNVYNATLQARKVYHGYGKCDAVSYRLETPDGIICYSGDTGDCEGVREMAKDADLFICEASAQIGDVDRAKRYGHLNPTNVGEIATFANAKKLVLFHYTGLDNDEDVIAEIKNAGFSGEVSMGKDGQVVNLV